MHQMMKCGHAANATRQLDGTTQPVCVICFMGGGPDDPAVQPATEEDWTTLLAGRMATCVYGRGKNGVHPDGRPVPSRPELAFFAYRPLAKTDEYFCGCWGWD